MRRLVLVLAALGALACNGDDSPPGTTAPGGATARAGGGTERSSWTLAGADMGRTAASQEPGPVSLPGIAWTNPVAKEILSEPVFAELAGRPAVLMTSDTAVVAFDLASGATLWSRTTASSMNASPLLAGGTVWAFGMDNVSLQLDPKDGAILRQHESDFPLEASPLLVGDTLFFEETSFSGKVPESRLHAVSASDGAKKWHADYLRAAGRPASSDGRHVFVASVDGIRALRLSDGGTAWSHSFPILVRVYSPVVAGGLVIVAGGSYEPGHLRAYDAATGEVRWEIRLAARLGAPPALAGEEVLVPLMDGLVHRIALKDGAAAGTLNPGARSDARPAVGAARIFVPAGQTVVAFDRTTFAEAWRLELESLEVSSAGIEHLAVMGRRLIVVRLDGHVHALESPDGA